MLSIQLTIFFRVIKRTYPGCILRDESSGGFQYSGESARPLGRNFGRRREVIGVIESFAAVPKFLFGVIA